MKQSKNKAEKTAKKKSKKSLKSRMLGILGVLLAFNAAGSAYSAYIVIEGVGGLIPTIMVAPQIILAALTLIVGVTYATMSIEKDI